jgi:hypothetical protein
LEALHYCPKEGAAMNMRYFRIIVLLVTLFIFTDANVLAQGPTHEAAMSALTSFFTYPVARADDASKNPDALKAEQNLMAFPPNIQKRLEKVVLMIMQESGANATRHEEIIPKRNQSTLYT